MKTWDANLVVCDDLLYSLNGKITLLGMYTGDIGIPTNPQAAGQMVFFFILQGDLSERPTKLVTLEVTLPGEVSKTMTIPPPIFADPMPVGRTKWFMRHPFLVAPAILRPGRIVAKVIYDNTEIVLGAPWITSASSS